MPTRSSIRRQLRSFLREPGNWRFKALLLAEDTNSRAVGEAWPVNPAERRHLQAAAEGPTPALEAGYSLAHRPDSRELSAARDVFDKDGAYRDLQYGTGLDRDQYISRMLINESPTELDVLWREELTETVVMGAAPRKVARDAAAVDQVDAKKGDLPTEGTEPYASTGAEGGSAEFDGVDYHQTAYEAEKHEHAFALSDELIDQSRPDAIEQHIRKAGRAIENAINRQFINELIDNATDYDANLSGSGSTDLRDLLLKASEAAADNDFDPTDTVVGHPEYWSELAGNNQLAGLNAVGSDTGSTDAIVGHDPFTVSGSAYDSGAQTYGFEADGERGALVYGREFVRLALYKDIAVSELKDPVTSVHDIQGGVATAWTDVVAVDEDEDGTYESVVRVQR